MIHTLWNCIHMATSHLHAANELQLGQAASQTDLAKCQITQSSVHQRCGVGLLDVGLNARWSVLTFSPSYYFSINLTLVNEYGPRLAAGQTILREILLWTAWIFFYLLKCPTAYQWLSVLYEEEDMSRGLNFQICCYFAQSFISDLDVSSLYFNDSNNPPVSFPSLLSIYFIYHDLWLISLSHTRTWCSAWSRSSWNWRGRRTCWSSVTRPSCAACWPISWTNQQVSSSAECTALVSNRAHKKQH